MPPADIGLHEELQLTLEGVFKRRRHAYIEHHGLRLPAQYGEGINDSIECGICPALQTAAKLVYLDRHYQDFAEKSRKYMALTIREAASQIQTLESLL